MLTTNYEHPQQPLRAEITTETTSESNNKDSTRIAREQDNPIAESHVVEEPAVVEVQPDSDSHKLDIVEEAEKHLDDIGATLPKPKKSKKQPKPQVTRERDRLFDGIALLCFGLDPKHAKTEETLSAEPAIGKRIGRIKKFLSGLEEPGTPESLWEWGKWWDRKYPRASKPRDPNKFAEHYLAFRQESKEPVLIGDKDYNYTNPVPPPIIEKMSPEADALFAELDSI
jgi:hypothetical protein